jgi:hypothetical protein
MNIAIPDCRSCRQDHRRRRTKVVSAPSRPAIASRRSGTASPGGGEYEWTSAVAKAAAAIGVNFFNIELPLGFQALAPTGVTNPESAMMVRPECLEQ